MISDWYRSFSSALGHILCDSYHIHWRVSRIAFVNGACQPNCTAHRDLVVWQQSVELVSDVYRTTRDFPSDERFGLTSQIRRAAVSIPSNIAEGQGRCSTGEFRHFLGHARGSLLELETQLTIARNLNYLRDEASIQLQSRIAEVGKILNGLLKSLW